jgi:hypothetical protein
MIPQVFCPPWVIWQITAQEWMPPHCVTPPQVIWKQLAWQVI